MGGVNVGVIGVEEDGVVGLIGVVGRLVDSGGVDAGGVVVSEVVGVAGGSIDDVGGVEMAEELGDCSTTQETATISRQVVKMRLKQSLVFIGQLLNVKNMEHFSQHIHSSWFFLSCYFYHYFD